MDLTNLANTLSGIGCIREVPSARAMDPACSIVSQLAGNSIAMSIRQVCAWCAYNIHENISLKPLFRIFASRDISHSHSYEQSTSSKSSSWSPSVKSGQVPSTSLLPPSILVAVSVLVVQHDGSQHCLLSGVMFSILAPTVA
jgi:hypothetical protein